MLLGVGVAQMLPMVGTTTLVTLSARDWEAARAVHVMLQLP